MRATYTSIHSNLLALHSIEECIGYRELLPSLLLQLVPVQERDGLHDDAQLDEAEEEEADAGHQPRLDGCQCLS